MGKQGGFLRSLIFLVSLYLYAPLLLTHSSSGPTHRRVTSRGLKDFETAHPFLSRPQVHRTRDVGASPSAANEGASNKNSPSSFPLHTQGGPVMSSPIKVYLLWSGTVSTIQQAYIKTFINALGQPSHTAGTAGGWWAVNTLYYGPSRNNYVSSSISVGGETTASGVLTFVPFINLSSNDIHTMVVNAINSRALPSDPNGIYLVITGPDVLQKDSGCGWNDDITDCGWSGQCDMYCGWHNYDSAMNLKYGWVGISPSSVFCSCVPDGASPPSVPSGIDIYTASAVSVIAHELAEAASDPQLNAWTDSNGENADRCSWYYGSLFYTPQYDIQVTKNGARWQYLIQYNWDPVKQTCALSA